MRLTIIAAILAAFLAAFLGGVAAHAQLSSWGWWGTSQNTFVPISVANPLPVACQ